MKLQNLILTMSAGALALSMASCENGDISFPDSDGGIRVYFPYQHPIRTIILGDITTYDNTADNEHRFNIYTTMGGAYEGRNLDVDVMVDNSLVSNLYFEDGVTPVQALPESYYSLDGTTMHFGGKHQGSIGVQLNDAFFADPDAVGNTYVIPLRITQAAGADSILSGKSDISNPVRQNTLDWSIQPKDYTLYLVNYINKYDGNYLRRGVDQITEFGKKKDNGFIKIVTGDQTSAPWDNQFWFVFKDNPIAEGDTWEYTMKVKAEKTASVASQVHVAPGEYKHWGAIGNIDFTTEWTEIHQTGTFTAGGTTPADGYSIAFNLNTGEVDKPNADANVYYLDDISLKINGKEVLVNGDCEGSETASFVVKTNIGDKAGQLIPVEFDYTYVPDYNVIAGTTSSVRHKEFVESDEVIKATTKSFNSVVMPISGLTDDGVPVSCNLLLTFDGNDNCTITSATDGYTAEGNGVFKSKSETKAWGNKDRDGLYLNYTIKLGAAQYQSTDTLVVRDRGTAASIREFTTIYKQ